MTHGLTLREKILAAATVLAIALAVFITVFNRVSERYETGKKRLAALSAAKSRLAPYPAGVKKLVREVSTASEKKSWLMERLALADGSLMTEKGFHAALAFIEEAAAESRATLVFLRVGSGSNTGVGGVSRKVVTVRIASGYEALPRFFDRLDTIPGVVSLSGVTIAADGDAYPYSSLVTDIELEVYVS